MSVGINALRNIGALADTAKMLVKEHGLLGLALLPLCHVRYYSQENKRYMDVPALEEVVANRAQVPEGAIITKELAPGQLECEYPVRNEGEDWIFDVHSHKSTYSHGRWTVEGRRLPNSAKLTREQAVARARKEFTGDSDSDKKM